MPITVGPVTALADATIPFVNVRVNNGNRWTNSGTVVLELTDLTERVTDMRFATSEAALATAAWLPFRAVTTTSIPATAGLHTIYAQVRDASGLASATATGTVMIDVIAPQSSISTLPGFTNVPSVDAAYTATDADAGVLAVEVWQRYRASSTAAWSSWSLIATGSASPITVALGLGDGDYEMYSIAIDRAQNREAAPAARDVAITLDRVPPITQVEPLPATSSGSPPIPFTASDDRSGISTVELWLRNRATSTGTWGAWILGPSGTTSPIAFTYPSGDGFYDFYTIGIDAAGNREVAPASADAATQKVSIATGTGKAWGSNSQGQLGNGTTNGSAVPVDVSDLTGIVSLGAGAEHSLAAKSDGTAWTWGQNANGELGDGTLTDRTTPVQVTGLSGVNAVAGGTAHSLALKSNGTVWSFGLNQNGQLGDGTTTQRTSPVQVSGLTGVIAIAAGSDHSLALKSDGTVWAWGKNTNGQLGDGSKTKRTTPVRSGTLTGVVAIAAGGDHSLALKSDGTVWAWGYNLYGQVGDGTTTNRTSPVQVTGLTGVVGIAACSNHSLAVKSDGTVWAWGNNGLGQLDDGTNTSRITPVRSGTLTGVTRLAAGAHRSLALKSDGTLWAWGYNLYGQVGDGTTTNRTSAVQVTGLSGIATMAGGAFFSLGATGGGS